MTTKEILIKALDLIESGIVNENKSITWAATSYDLDIEKIRQAKVKLFKIK